VHRGNRADQTTHAATHSTHVSVIAYALTRSWRGVSRMPAAANVAVVAALVLVLGQLTPAAAFGVCESAGLVVVRGQQSTRRHRATAPAAVDRDGRVRPETARSLGR
jgi:hypothetical protein